ncbi:hypothetical protein FIV00_27865 [Labrenzia sp. THAF82]|nr:hypothetical protein FIV00_27865 [Labrenzia sp. THAF82]
MCFGQFLNVSSAAHQLIMEELHGADLQHVQNDLGVLRIVLVPTVVQSFAGSGQCNGGDEPQIEPDPAKMIRQRPVIVARGLKFDPR